MNQNQVDGSPMSDVRKQPAFRLHTFSSLRHRNFRLIWSTTFFSSAAMWVQQVTLGWLIYDLTGSALKVGMLMAVRSMPALLAGPLAGVLIDRTDRRKLLITTQLAMAILAIGFATLLASPYLEVWHLYIFTLMTGVGWSLNIPLRQAMVANSVPKEDLMNAFALNSMAFNLNRMIGPAIGGILIALSGAATNFFLQALFYIAVALVVLPIRIPQQDFSAARRSSMISSLQEGIQYAIKERTILSLILLALVPSLFMMPFTMGLMPVFAAEVLNAGPKGLGLLLSFNGFGALLGVLILASLGNVKRKGLLLLAAATAAGLMVMILSLTRSMPLALLTLTGVGLGQQVYMVTNNTLIQTITPDTFRGRVMSLYHLDHGFTPLGALCAGAIAEFWGSPLAILIGGSSAVILILLMGSKFHSLRRA